jgi:hypothetical protein
MDYKDKYIKYKDKYLKLKAIYNGGTILTDFHPITRFDNSLIELIKSNCDEGNIENTYNNLYNKDDNKVAKFKIINIDINNIILKYSGNNIVDPNKFKNDTYSAVMIFESIVIRIFKLDLVRSKQIDELYKLLLKNECPYLEHIYQIHINEPHNLYYVISKKIDNSIYIKDLSNNKNILRSQITRALEYLAEHGWNQNDTRIDNIGYDKDTNTYRLYDFGLASYNENLHDKLTKDISNLDTSIKFNLELLETL